MIFDLDGVITDTASVHFAAWKRVFDAYLHERAERTAGRRDEDLGPFEADDYHRFVDGMSRYDGVARFLASRGVSLPHGEPEDPPERETVCGIGNRKDVEFHRRLAQEGVQPFSSSIELVERLRERGVATAVISASRNCSPVLRAAGIEHLFDAEVDGVQAAELGLPGKPDPAVFIEASRRLGVPPSRSAVVEDALAGVRAGSDGGFGLVVGVARGVDPEEMRAAGADAVVADLRELQLEQ